MIKTNDKSALSGLNTYLMFNLLGGPLLFKTRYTVNLFKGLTWIYCIFLIHYFKNYSLIAYIYTYKLFTQSFARILWNSMGFKRLSFSRLKLGEKIDISKLDCRFNIIGAWILGNSLFINFGAMSTCFK